tara:strand:- start:175 stop:789 length:615 start_codon:yes stop_codon:yes gene_type:complete
MGFIGVQPASVPLTADDVPDLPATKITSGTFPALNGSNLTSLTAGNLTGTLPAISGANLTGVSAGKVLQIKSAYSSATVATASTSFTHFSGIDLSITPTSASSKILIHFSSNGDNEASGRQAQFGMWREISSSNVVIGGNSMGKWYGVNSRIVVPLSFVFIDEPNTTSAVRYRPVVKSDGGNQVLLGAYLGSNTTLTLQEITHA